MTQLPLEPMRGASASEWRRYAAKLMRHASDAIQRACYQEEDKIAIAIDGTYLRMLGWLTSQVDRG